MQGVVFGAIGLLGAGALLLWSTLQNTGHSLAIDRSAIRAIEQDAALFRIRRRRLPASIEELYPDDTLPRDSWGRPYLLKLEAGEVVVLSYGADGLPGGERLAADLVGSEP